MVVVGLDTSGDRVGVALCVSGLPAAELVVPAEKRSLPRILPAIDRVVSDAGLEVKEVDLFAVVLGPGSWTGLRLGVMTAKTLAYTLGKPVVGIDTLTMLAYGLRYTSRPVVSVLPARPGLVFVASYRCDTNRPVQTVPIELVSSQALAPRIPSTAIVVGEIPTGELAGVTASYDLGGPRLSFPSPSAVAEAGLHEYERSGPADLHALVPAYLKDPDLTRRS